MVVFPRVCIPFVFRFMVCCSHVIDCMHSLGLQCVDFSSCRNRTFFLSIYSPPSLFYFLTIKAGLNTPFSSVFGISDP